MALSYRIACVSTQMIFDVCCVRQSPYNLARLPQVGKFSKGKNETSRKTIKRLPGSLSIRQRYLYRLCP